MIKQKKEESSSEKYFNCYFPMTANVLTVGHIQCLEYLTQFGFVTVGLLTAKGLKGYKEESVPYVDRKYILDTVAQALEDMVVVAQDSLNPARNIKKYGCNAIASGDGWESVELKTIKKLGINIINIKLKGERDNKKYSSSKILKR